MAARALEACAEWECSIHKTTASPDKLTMRVHASDLFRVLLRDKSVLRRHCLNLFAMRRPICRTSEVFVFVASKLEPQSELTILEILRMDN